MANQAGRHLRLLGEGVYSVSEVCRILQPTMTPRKVHYWLNTNLLDRPISWGRPGHPTLLSFQQLLSVRTVQHLRDELRIPLPKIREAFAAFEHLLAGLFAEYMTPASFAKGVRGSVVVKVGEEQFEVPVGQGVLKGTLPELGEYVRATRHHWETRAFEIPGHPSLESNALILSGAPVVKGTRLETAAIAALVDEEEVSPAELREVRRLYPDLPRRAITDALKFEGLTLAA